jgi:hypothetical protein
MMHTRFMSKPAYTLEWYEEEDGTIPVLRWLREELTPRKRRALGTAMNEILQHLGPQVVGGNFGVALGGGLFEFRLDQDVEQILARKGRKAKRRDRGVGEKILLRVFCHAHGDRIVLLLGGYDKGERPSSHHQQGQIGTARERLKTWKARSRMSQASRAGKRGRP